MTATSETYFTRIYWVLCSAVFLVIALRAFFIPFSHDESATFFFYIQSDNYLPYKAHVYTNNHVLNSALANLCYHVAGSHRFVLRLPNVLSFWILCAGIFRFFQYMRGIAPRVILTVFLILTFNFLDFFELCRGYGLSMAFLVLGLSHLQDYFVRKRFSALVIFSLCLQLALAANLILIELLTLLIAFILLYQWRNKSLLSLKNGLLLLVNLALLVYWIKFSFFLKESGVFDSGAGGYWELTFKALMFFLFSTSYGWIQVLTCALFATSLLAALATVFKQPFDIARLFEPRVFYSLALAVLIVAIYLQKQWLDVNYPEDRTGLFLYILFALGVAFFFDTVPNRISLPLALGFAGSSLVFFCLSFNLDSFSNYFYQVMPRGIFARLQQEHELGKKDFTVGGSLSREMTYAFLNYRGGGELNPMDVPERMCMNCDYYFALKREKPYYQFFYDELAEDRTWDRVLLKRKTPIGRQNIYKAESLPGYYKGGQEFFEFVRLGDSLSKPGNCLEAKVELFFRKVPKPFHAFLVFSVSDENGSDVYYKRLPLYWLADDLNGQKRSVRLTTGPLPANYKTVCVYLWNIDRTDCDFSLESLSIYGLKGKGVNFTIPKSFYPLVEKITQQPLL